MRSLSLLLMLLVLGCSEPGPQLRYVATGFDATTHPLAFSLKLQNDGGAVTFDTVNLAVDYQLFLHEEDVASPQRLDLDVVVFRGDPGMGDMGDSISFPSFFKTARNQKSN